MSRGKRTCKILKEIRQQIADNNEIEYITSECHFQGECKGTCPKCESEVLYLESELNKRRQLGKVVTVAGISLGIAGAFSAYNPPNQETTLETPAEIQQDTMYELGEAPAVMNQDLIELKTIHFVTEGDIVSIDIPTSLKDGEIAPIDIVTDTIEKKKIIRYSGNG